MSWATKVAFQPLRFLSIRSTFLISLSRLAGKPQNRESIRARVEPEQPYTRLAFRKYPKSRNRIYGSVRLPRICPKRNHVTGGPGTWDPPSRPAKSALDAGYLIGRLYTASDCPEPLKTMAKTHSLSLAQCSGTHSSMQPAQGSKHPSARRGENRPGSDSCLMPVRR